MVAYPVPEPEQAEEGRAAKRIFFVVEILIFILVIAATMNVVEKMIDGMQMCSLWEERVLLYGGETRVLSAEIAKEITESYVGDVFLVGTSIEPCGVAYGFKDTSGEKYVVCEDGSLYQYIQYCDNN